MRAVLHAAALPFYLWLLWYAWSLFMEERW